MRLDNHLFRVAEIALRNQERLRAWRYRYEEYQTQQKNKNAAQKEKENVSKTDT
jgi:hypothetical protein